MSYSYTNFDNFYDIESVKDAFTYAMYNPKINIISVFVLWGESQINPLDKNTKELIKEKIYEVNPELKDQHTEINVYDNIDTLMTLLIPLFGNKLPNNSINRQIIHQKYNQFYGRPLDEDIVPENISNTYQLGFNTKAYDMPLIAFDIDKWINEKIPNESNAATNKDYIAAKDIKQVSDKLIHANNYTQVAEFDFKQEPSKIIKAMRESNRFVDVRLLLGKSAKLTLGLKRYAAQAGWQILESDLVKSHDSLHEISEQLRQKGQIVSPETLLADMIAYNVLDVLNTKRLFELPNWQNGLNQHLALMNRFKDEFENKIHPDSTNSSFIEYVIVPNNNGKPIKLEDSKRIEFKYPTIHGEVDLLDLAHQKGLPEEAYAFYDNYRKATSNDDYSVIENANKLILNDERLAKAKEEKRLNDTGKALDIWVQDSNGNPSNAHINMSIGGAHGEYSDYQAMQDKIKHFENFIAQQTQIINFFNEIADQYDDAKQIAKIRLDISKRIKNQNATLADFDIPTKGEPLTLNDLVTVNSKQIKPKKAPKISVIPKDYGHTINGTNIVHIDVDSLYPSLLTLLKVLIRKDGKDVYGDLRNERLNLKKSLPEHKADYTEEDYEVDMVQRLLKLLLNSATGAADANFDTNILVSNKITSMRIIGNILIYLLSMMLADAGGTVVSINTDGLYVANLSEETADKIAKAWREEFQLSAKPETIDRFISKDTNNRLEVSNNKIDYAGGGSFSAWRKPSMEKAVAKPAIIDETLANYLAFAKDPFDKFDEKSVKQYLQYKIASAKTPADKEAALLQFQWIFTGSENKNRIYFMHDMDTNTYTKLNNVSRAFITRPEVSNQKIQLLAINKTIQTENPIARDLIKNKDSEITLHLDDGLHHITDSELAADNLINEIASFTKKTMPDLPAWYEDNVTRIENTLSTLGVDMSNVSLLSLVESLKDFKKFFSDIRRNYLTGKNSRICRANFVASPRVAPEMHFELHNESLASLAKTNFLTNNSLDLDAYVNLIHDEWSIWAEDIVSL